MQHDTHVTARVGNEDWVAEVDRYGKPRAFYAEQWARQGPRVWTGDKYEDQGDGLPRERAVVLSGGSHYRPAWGTAVPPPAEPSVQTDKMPMGPLLPERHGFLSTVFGPFIDGIKTGLKKCFGDASYDEYERMELRRITAYRKEMTVKRQAVVSDATEESEVLATVGLKEVKHVPRVVVHVVCEMRMKLGLGAMDRSVSGNVALVRAEAARIMRNMNMRRIDAAAHLELVEECFFGENTHYNATRWRQNMAQSNIITRWLYKKKPNPYGFDC